MISKIDISDIRLEQLDRASVAWISKFAHTLRQHNGKVIRLRDDAVLRKVVYEAKMTDCAELRDIYIHLKTAMRAHINSGQFERNIKHENASNRAPMREP